MNHLRRIAWSALVGALTFTTQLHAQGDWTVSFGAGGAREIVHSRFGTTETRLTGSLFNGEAVVSRHRFVARLRYGQGHVTSDSTARDVVEGELLAGYMARRWLQIWLGPRARTFVTSGLSDRRWLFWTGGLSARGGIFPGRVDSFVELWQAFSGSLNRPAASASGRGVELGLEAMLPGHPWRLRFAYRIEQGRLDDGRRDTVEGLTLTAGYRLVR